VLGTFCKGCLRTVHKLVGGADGIRTHDLLDAIEARSQLRHGPTGAAEHTNPSIQAPDSSISCTLGDASQEFVIDVERTKSPSFPVAPKCGESA
jgi:hypothetical protein